MKPSVRLLRPTEIGDAQADRNAARAPSAADPAPAGASPYISAPAAGLPSVEALISDLYRDGDTLGLMMLARALNAVVGSRRRP